MDIRQLEYYSALVRKGNFTRAADELFVTRQALSKAVRNLEHELGDKLVFVRDGHVQPTETGMRLYLEAASIIESYRRLEEHFAPRADSRSRQTSLSIAMGHGTAFSLPEGHLERFRAQHPQVRLSIEEAPTDSVLELVASSEADLGIVGSTPDYLQDFDMKLLVSKGIHLCVPLASELSRKDSLSIKDLDGQPFVTYGKRNHLHRFFVEQCKMAGVRPDILLTSSDVSMLTRSAQASGALYFCFPDFRADGRVVKPLDLDPESQFGTYAIMRKGIPAGSPANLFWNWTPAPGSCLPRSGACLEKQAPDLGRHEPGAGVCSA